MKKATNERAASGKEARPCMTRPHATDLAAAPMQDFPLGASEFPQISHSQECIKLLGP